MNIGERIKSIREQKGYSQKELASMMGISNSRLNNWEKGLNVPNADVFLPMLCKFLETDANTLLGWNNPMQLKADAEELANEIVSNEKIVKILPYIASLSEDDMSLVVSIIERLSKKEK